MHPIQWDPHRLAFVPQFECNQDYCTIVADDKAHIPFQMHHAKWPRSTVIGADEHVAAGSANLRPGAIGIAQQARSIWWGSLFNDSKRGAILVISQADDL